MVVGGADRRLQTSDKAGEAHGEGWWRRLLSGRAVGALWIAGLQGGGGEEGHWLDWARLARLATGLTGSTCAQLES